MGCLSRDKVNGYNFFQFRKATTVVVADFGSPIDTCADAYTALPRRHILNNRPYAPHLVSTRAFNIYVNFDTPIVSDPAAWTVRLVDLQGTEDDPVNITLTKVTVSTGNFRVALEGNIDASVPTGKQYQFILKSTATAVEYVSNCFWLDPTSAESYLTKLEYRHSVDLDNYDYATLWTGKYNTVWLDMDEKDRQTDHEVSQYREGSTGLVRNQRTMKAEYVIIETRFDFEGNDAMRSLSIHDDIKLNGQVVTVKTPFKKNINRRSNMEFGETEFWLDAKMALNLNG